MPEVIEGGGRLMTSSVGLVKRQARSCLTMITRMILMLLI